MGAPTHPKLNKQAFFGKNEKHIVFLEELELALILRFLHLFYEGDENMRGLRVNR